MKTVFFENWLYTKYFHVNDVTTLREYWEDCNQEYQNEVFNNGERYQRYAEVFYNGLNSDMKSNTNLNYLKFKYPDIVDPINDVLYLKLLHAEWDGN